MKTLNMLDNIDMDSPIIIETSMECPSKFAGLIPVILDAVKQFSRTIVPHISNIDDIVYCMGNKNKTKKYQCMINIDEFDNITEYEDFFKTIIKRSSIGIWKKDDIKYNRELEILIHFNPKISYIEENEKKFMSISFEWMEAFMPNMPKED